MTTVRIASWSNVLPTRTDLVEFGPDVFAGASPVIPRGAGRSFGDAAYLGGGRTAHAIGSGACVFDESLDHVTCPAMMPMGEVQRAVERAGRYLAVFGGTQWATSGGAVAADIHTKDDEALGSCGNHVDSLTLLTPDGVPRECSREIEPDLFAATIGGMGLTGFITAVTFRLLPPHPIAVRIRARVFETIADMQALMSANTTPLQVAEWVDLTHQAPPGILWSAASEDGDVPEPRVASEMWLPRIKAFNRATVRVIERGTLVAARRLNLRAHRRRFHYGSAHEAVKNWNRLFGRRGFIEYHFGVPAAAFADAFAALLEGRRRFSVPACFAAAKRLGAMARAGMLSFPSDGYGMNFQAPDSPRARQWLDGFTETVIALGGRVYLAKDSTISSTQMRRMYRRLPEWQEVVRRYDPARRLQSDLSRRLGLKPW